MPGHQEGLCLGLIFARTSPLGPPSCPSSTPVLPGECIFSAQHQNACHCVHCRSEL